MTSSSTIWLRKKRKEQIKTFGGKCQDCGSTRNLQFAHKRRTKLHGSGRGGYNRYRDVKDRPKSFMLLCRKCNLKRDRRRRKKRQK